MLFVRGRPVLADIGLGKRLSFVVAQALTRAPGKAEDAPALVEAILRCWQTHRATPDESFVAFARRHEIAALQALVEQSGDAA